MDGEFLSIWAGELTGQLSGRNLQRIFLDGAHFVSLEWGCRSDFLCLHLQPWSVFACLQADWQRRAIRKSAETVLAMRTPWEESLIGAGFLQASILPGERILTLDLQKENEILFLIVELIPAHPNLFLADKDRKILLALDRERALRRGLDVGQRWYPPKPGVPEKETAGDGTAAPVLHSRFPLHPPDWRQIDPWKDIRLSLGGKGDPAPAGFLEERFASVNQLLLRFADLAEDCLHFREQRKKLLSATDNEIRRLRRALEAAENDRQHMEDPAGLRKKGEMLLAHLSQLKQNWAILQRANQITDISVEDYYDPDAPALTISIQPRKSPQGNADDYFKAARKADRGLEFVHDRIAGLNRSLRQTEAEKAKILAATGLPDLTILARSEAPARKSSPGKGRSQATADRTDKVEGCRHFISRDGYSILIGQSARHNEHLTFRLAGEYDLWLHVADYSGSHVIIRNPSKKAVPRETLVEAAQLAAFYSTARSQSWAEVRYTEKRFIQKVKGGAPGLVRLQKFQSLKVQPSQLREKRPASPESPKKNL